MFGGGLSTSKWSAFASPHSLARFFPRLTPVPSLLPSEHTFEINRERAIDYLNTRENVCQSPTYPLVLCPFLFFSADNSLYAVYRRL